ncbi:MAG: C40 family peptidase [Ferruginibacter sp.]
MKYAVCAVPLAAVRLNPDHRDEMVSQLLFGEQLTVLEKNKDGWALLENNWDGYMGWCCMNQFITVNELPAASTKYTGAWVNEIRVNNQKMMLPFGCPLPQNEVPGLQVGYNGIVLDASDLIFSEEQIRKIAFTYLNSSYLWGGRTVFGIDCSGFAQAVYRMMNIKLLRDARLQVSQGEPVGFLQEVCCGDLAFFDEFGEIVHVGIMLNAQEIIHASGKVRIDHIDTEGIIQKETGLRTHKLRVIKRIN